MPLVVKLREGIIRSSGIRWVESNLASKVIPFCITPVSGSKRVWSSAGFLRLSRTVTEVLPDS